MKRLFILLIPLLVACTTSKNIVHSQTTITRNIDTIVRIEPKNPKHIDYVEPNDTLNLLYGNVKQKIYFDEKKNEIAVQTVEQPFIIPIKINETVKTNEVKKAAEHKPPKIVSWIVYLIIGFFVGLIIFKK